MPEEYSPSLLCESSSITPHGHEFWFINHSPSQRIYVFIEPTNNKTTTAAAAAAADQTLAEKITASFPLPHHENEPCERIVDNENITELRDALSSHITTTNNNTNNKKRLGFTLRGNNWSEEHAPPCLSQNAVWSPPDDITKLHISSVKPLETREIRPNVRIARLLTTSGDRCIFKTVEYKAEAVGLSFEVSNYKSLLEKGVGEWIPRLLAMVYIHDDTEEDTTTPPEELKSENTHFIGAAFEFFPQKDLTTHYSTASTVINTSWTVQLLRAVTALEEAGFEHWDLKCENIVLDTAPPHTPPPTKQAERRGSISHHPTDEDPGRIKIIDLENSKASSAWKVGEKEISMVYSMGKTVLEMFQGKVPDIGEVKEEDVEKLPEPARTVVEMCCCGGGDSVPTAREVLEKVEGMGWK